MYVVNANPRQVMITVKVIKTSPRRPGWMGGWVAGWLGGWVASAVVMVSPDIIMSILTLSTELSYWPVSLTIQSLDLWNSIHVTEALIQFSA